MRNPSQLTGAISKAVQQDMPSVKVMAIGGSNAASEQDDKSDLDLVFLLKNGPLIQSSRDLRDKIDHLLSEPGCLVGGPSWKEGFGCRTTYLYSDGFKIEFFVNTFDTVPVVPRVLRWTPVWGGEYLNDIQASVSTQLNLQGILRKAQFDVAYAHMSICRHLSRGEVFAARHVMSSLVAIALALRLAQCGGDYDTVASYKRIQRDGLSSDPRVLEIQRLIAEVSVSVVSIKETMHGLVDLTRQMIDEMASEDKELIRRQQDLGRIATAAEAWL